nr:reverse transcriptase domain-containing protein [Tanacetum cinerariifolium]
MTWSHGVNVKEKSHKRMKCHKMQSKFVRYLTRGALILWDRSRLHEGIGIYSWPSITCQNGWKRMRSPPTMPELFPNSKNLSLPGLKLPVPSSVIAAYENSLIYKEKTKRIYDSKIKDRVFNVGDRVLLFNSRLKIFLSKLKTRWTGPFTITQVFLYGTVKLSQTDGPKFKVNGHRLKHYFEGDIPPMVVPDLQTFPKDN